MSSPILRGGNLIVTEQAIREGVRQVLIPLWNCWYFFALYANAAGVRRVRRAARHVVGPPDGPLPAGQDPAVRRGLDPPARRLRGRQRLRHHPAVPRRAVELVHPPLPGALLGGRRSGRRRGVRHALHRARDRLPGHRAAAAADHGGDLARPDRRALGAPDRLAVGRRRCRRTPRWWRRWTRCATSARPGSALRKAAVPAQPAAPVVADRRGRRRRAAPGVRGDRRRRAQREGPSGCSTPTTPMRRRTASPQRLTVNARAAGPRLGKDVQTAIKGSKSGDWSVAEDGTVTAGGLVLEDGEYALETVASGGEGFATGLLPGGGFVVLDTAVTPRARGRGCGPRPGARGPAGPPRRRPRRLRPDRADDLRGRGGRRRRPHARRADPARDPGVVATTSARPTWRSR